MAGNIIFRTMNRLHIALYRASGGRLLGSVVGSPVLILTTTGRKSGKARTVPLVYASDGTHYAVIASDNPGWHHNLKNNSQASIELKTGKIQVTARDANSAEAALWWDRIINRSSAFKSSRDNPHHQIVILAPLR